MSEVAEQVEQVEPMFIVENRWSNNERLRVRVATPEEIEEDGSELYDLDDTLRYMNRRARENHNELQGFLQLSDVLENAGAQYLVNLAAQWVSNKANR
jgi:hypothetical protein